MDRDLDYKKTVVLAVLWWLIMFGAVSLVLPWYSQFAWMKVSAAVFAGVLALVLSSYIPLYGYSNALLFGMIFVVVGIALDALVTYRFNSEIFTYWQMWLGYALVLVAPLLRIMKAYAR
ncbi:hypothetical protein A2662_00365 [Candidatus Giovannonibacteria bacterium RIFCSPHIGHO2_01_FULL_45_33]|uniref:Uncharacterized protein n=1 Tax=Candidatus Giovannonibacteria bacterium RIFCSPLOWO2_01_FULL_45_34 TaxID=1798351 RepID=A0A1F5WY84_9BACT|nr:MAG: hypothetical protein A2662_00365 [Candidatus Giovannonibacteria bacterium RIFCSPHIGHO2_01_FULL_45_33]OGF70644.1 MAG: hypothetical protein A3C73_02065 [Candidatus Giovannonibacteria bacterium RIFCSPHIGHO2_02_FULL_44_11]OGF80604.1 MAG: hypothetical protein A2930_02885 [Candidatus Giovannonibacteria bacterium RIFCSPLOWO2_01_FULL_45_34]